MLAAVERDPVTERDELPTVSARPRPTTAAAAGADLIGPDELTVPGRPQASPLTAGATIDRGSQPHRVDVAASDDVDAVAMFAQATARDRYQAGPLLGVGGMGEVVARDDRATGRTVAVKRIRPELADGTLLRRFAREARIQAQLEHPSIVPVYDVGVDPDGAQYFTMKKIRGHSLARILEQLRAGDADTTTRYSRRRLLTILSTVALTVEYAHRRGVIHRDLKPANVMLGDLGEVYVLDWGLADVVGSAEASLDPMPLSPAALLATAADTEPGRHEVLDASAHPETGTGVMLGTPGYAAPEMLDRDGRTLDHRADVYALGCILHELLTLERLHSGQVLGQILGSTLDVDGAHPSARVADIPPELDALCWQATRRDPALRLGSAAELAGAVDAYLDGDRDLIERRRLADVHAQEAGVALTRADAGASAAALRAVTTALALDPSHPGARAMLVRVLTEPGPEAVAGAEAAQVVPTTRALRRAAVGAMLASSTFALYLPIVLWMGIRSWWQLGMIAAGVVLTLLITYRLYRRPIVSFELPVSHLLMSSIGLMTGAIVISPVVLLPAIAIATGIGYIAIFGHRIRLVMACVVAIVLVPLGLELIGVLPPSIRFVDDTLVLVPRMVGFPRTGTLVFLVVTHVVVIVTALAYVAQLRQTAGAAERRLGVQAWQLAQLVPHDARGLLAEREPAAAKPSARDR